MKELMTIQQNLKAPKAQFNSFGKYKYRKCEDILEALKPILASVGCILTISDEIVQVGDRYYVKATAVLKNKEGVAVTSSAYAREADKKTGMDESQITGTASSYARKYALNGLFCIDDTMDEDTEERRIESQARSGKTANPLTDARPFAPEKKPLTMAHIAADDLWPKLASQIYNAHSLANNPGMFDPVAWVRERSVVANDVASILREKYIEYYLQRQRK